MPEIHPGASIIGNQPVDGDSSSCLARLGNLATSPDAVQERHTCHTNKISGKEGWGGEGKAVIKAQSMHRMITLIRHPEPAQDTH